MTQQEFWDRYNAIGEDSEEPGLPVAEVIARLESLAHDLRSGSIEDPEGDPDHDPTAIPSARLDLLSWGIDIMAEEVAVIIMQQLTKRALSVEDKEEERLTQSAVLEMERWIGAAKARLALCRSPANREDLE